MRNSSKVAVIATSVMMIFALSACDVNINASNPESAEAAASSESGELSGIAEEEMTGMANPMVEVFDDADFAEKLGIPIDTSFFTGENQKRFIIGEMLADVRFDVTNVNGDNVECMFRATKDDEYAKNPYELIAGVYASDFSDEVSISYPSDEGDIEMFSVDSATENCHITRWDFSGAHYVFSVFGTTSQMQLGALYDSLMLAIGADHPVISTVEPLTSEIDVTDISGGTFAVNMANVETDENGTIADFTIYSMDLYDAVDLNAINSGDEISVKISTGEEPKKILVDTIEHKTVTYTKETEAMGSEPQGDYDVILINGGLDNVENGGVEFIACEGGTYRFFGFDDYATYTQQGTVSLKIAEDAEIIDHSEDWKSEEEVPAGVSIKTTDLMQFTANDEIGFSFLNTTIEVENGEVTKITRRFTP